MVESWSESCVGSFDIEDRKGLEIVILTALLTFQDTNEAHHSKNEGASQSPPSTMARIASISVAGMSVAGMSEKPPPPPPKPAPKTGIDRIAEIQAATGDYNEVTIEDEGSIQDYAQYCSNLLEVRGNTHQVVVRGYISDFFRMTPCSSLL